MDKPVFRTKSQRQYLDRRSLDVGVRKKARLDEEEEKLQVEREKELELIRKQYIGFEKKTKKKASEKFRFCFDWDKSDDTSTDTNSLHQNPHVACLLFGRGSWAGIDIHEQKKKKKHHWSEKDLEKNHTTHTPEIDIHEQKHHWSKKVLEDMTPRDWRIFKEDFNISYKGSRIPNPIRNWKESNLSWELLKVVDRAGYNTPTPIQMASIPLGLQQRDVIGVAETGSGKTAAFLLPLLNYITRLPPMTQDNIEEGPYAVVMAPTRELAHQIEHETVKFARYLGVKVVSIVGGKSIDEQSFKIRQGCEVMIATPGRLIDCLERQYVVLNQCNYVVLDEADRMIDMGFEPQIVRVLDAMPSTNFKPWNEDEELDEKKIYRTTYMFSATMPPAVERLARKYLRNPVVVTTSTAGKATHLISQRVMFVKESQKMVKLQELLDQLRDQTVIVFVNTRKTADFIYDHKANYHLTTLHGGKSEDQRGSVLEDFRNKRYNVLVATDLAGRGIDIPDLAHVINYDMAPDIETYTHRIGRTGRAGKKGIATTLLTLQDSRVFYDLKQMLIQSKSPVPPELSRHEASKYKPGSVPDRPPRRNNISNVRLTEPESIQSSAMVLLDVESINSYIAWDFSIVQGKMNMDIGFSLEHTNSSGDKTLMFPYRRYECDQGNFSTCLVGTYKLVWDNSYSTFFKKVLRYKVDCIPPVVEPLTSVTEEEQNAEL